MSKIKTSWEKAAKWYQELLEKKNTYQKMVILPNLLRLIEIKKGETILDLACGPGFFAREFFKEEAKVIGVDSSEEMIKLAKEKFSAGILFKTAPADKLPFISNETIDKITMILAIENIENVKEVFMECNRVLKPKGKLFLVMNHPAFRIPKASSWEWDKKNKVLYRRVDRYLSEDRIKIQMHPGARPNEYTISFHRPLQSYFKALRKSNFYISRLEEWISHKKSDSGHRAPAENKIRKEIPVFLFIEAVKI